MVDRRAGAVWSLFGVIAVVSSVLVMHRPAWDRLSDLHIYYGAAQTVQAGRPLYGYVAENGGPFTYPPFAVLLLQPMTTFPEPAVQVMWLVLTCAAIVAIAAAVGGAIATPPRHRQLVVAAVACAVLVSAPGQSNLRFGQVSWRPLGSAISPRWATSPCMACCCGSGLPPGRCRCSGPSSSR